MSIEVELRGKGGCVCQPARRGEIRCPLIVRPTSEDVVVGNVFGTLQHIPPHLWLNAILNQALGTDEFRQVWFKDFSLRLWEKQPRYPPELLDFREGHTEPDVIIEWENPPTTVWIEAKWLSGFSKGTVNKADNDQISRSIRMLRYQAGQIQADRLFHTPQRRGVLILVLLKPLSGELLQLQANHVAVGATCWNSISRVLREGAVDRPAPPPVRDVIKYLLTKLRAINVSEKPEVRTNIKDPAGASTADDEIRSEGLLFGKGLT